MSLVGDDTLKIQTEEIQAGQWLKPEEAINRVEYKGAAKILKKALTLFEKEVGNDKDKD